VRFAGGAAGAPALAAAGRVPVRLLTTDICGILTEESVVSGRPKREMPTDWAVFPQLLNNSAAALYAQSDSALLGPSVSVAVQQPAEIGRVDPGTEVASTLPELLNEAS